MNGGQSLTRKSGHQQHDLMRIDEQLNTHPLSLLAKSASFAAELIDREQSQLVRSLAHTALNAVVSFALVILL